MNADNLKSGKNMQTEFLLLSLFESPFLTFAQVCKAIGISRQHGYNLRQIKQFPIPLVESPLRAAVQDVAAYIDAQREIAQEKVNE